MAAIDRLVAEDGGRLNAKIQGKTIIGGLTFTGCTPLMLAAYRGHDAAVARLLALGADSGTMDENGNFATRRACMGRASSTLALLLDASASMDARNNLGRTPLIVAAEFGATQCSTLLLAHCGDALGEQLEKVDNDGNTAAHLASNRGHSPALTLLLDAGSSMTGHNTAGTTPLIAAASKGTNDCVTLLLTRSGDVIAEHLAMVDNRGNSAVHWACTENHPPLWPYCSIPVPRWMRAAISDGLCL